MAKIFISWVDIRNDFEPMRSGQVNEQGLHAHFHHYHYVKGKYDRHILLCYIGAEEVESDVFIASMRLVSYLRKAYPKRQIELQFAGIANPIDLYEVKSATERILLELEDHEVDIFYNTGYQMMQLAWYICHTTTCQKFTKLLHMRRLEYNKEDSEPTLYVIETKEELRSTVPYYLRLKELEQNKETAQMRQGIPKEMLMSPTLTKVYERAKKIAASGGETTVLIWGASGTGKENLAAYIYHHAPDRKQSYNAINCAAYSDELLPSELFGHEQGAFTDAKTMKKGLFETANNGTIFLDELGDASAFVQVSLLRVLQTGTFYRAGGTKEMKTKVKVIAATNKDLIQACREGKFREDLLHRFTVHIRLPSFSEYSAEEKLFYINGFIKQESTLFGVKKIRLSKEAIQFLLAYDFSGNMRQLKSLIKSLYIFYKDNPTEISVADIQYELLDFSVPFSDEIAYLNWKEVEKNHIEKVLKKYKHVYSQAQEALGYGSINTLKSKMKEYGIAVEKK